MPDEVSAPRSLKEKQRQEREDLILRVAEEVILEKGYHEASMDEIAARVGIAKGTLYLHFARKEELVIALLKRELKNFLHVIQQVHAMEITPQEKLERLLREIYLGIMEKRARLLYTLFNTADLQIVLREEHRNIVSPLAAQVMEIIDEGKASGSFVKDIPTEIMFSMFMNMVSPRSYKFLVLERGVSIEDLVHYAARVYFDGVSVRE